MGPRHSLLNEPVKDCYVETGEGNGFTYAGVTMQGWRKYQEDRFVCIPDFYEGYGFFAVYDGHGGSEVAEYLKRELHPELKETLALEEDDMELALGLSFLTLDNVLRGSNAIREMNLIISEESRASDSALRILKDNESLEETLAKFYRDRERQDGAGTSTEAGPSADPPIEAGPSAEPPAATGESAPRITEQDSDMEVDPSEVHSPLEFLLSGEIESTDSDDEDYNVDEDQGSSSNGEEETNSITTEEFLNQQPGFLSGSTATVAVIGPNKVFLANVGDSRCVMSRGGVAYEISVDHNPEVPEEKARVVAAGGSVSEDGRIDNVLNLSRAFGDFKYKNEALEPLQHIITVEPHVTSIDFNDDDKFLIIASDGIWHSMSSQEVVDYVETRLTNGDSTLQGICEEIMNHAIAEEKNDTGIGCDNMTCILVKINKIK